MIYTTNMTEDIIYNLEELRYQVDEIKKEIQDIKLDKFYSLIKNIEDEIKKDKNEKLINLLNEINLEIKNKNLNIDLKPNIYLNLEKIEKYINDLNLLIKNKKEDKKIENDIKNEIINLQKIISKNISEFKNELKKIKQPEFDTFLKKLEETIKSIRPAIYRFGSGGSGSVSDEVYLKNKNSQKINPATEDTLIQVASGIASIEGSGVKIKDANGNLINPPTNSDMMIIIQELQNIKTYVADIQNQIQQLKAFNAINGNGYDYVLNIESANTLYQIPPQQQSSNFILVISNTSDKNIFIKFDNSNSVGGIKLLPDQAFSINLASNNAVWVYSLDFGFSINYSIKLIQ